MKKRLYIKTYGCQMNVYDSDRMADVLAPHGYALVTGPEGADMMILNTCHIREKATEKTFSELGRMKAHKDAKEGAVLAVAGCVAQAEGAEILRRAPYVDIVFGPQTYHRLPEMIARANQRRGVIDTDFPVESKFDYLPETQHTIGTSAFVSIQEGCDKFCTFCVVPYTRGAEYSRPVQDITKDIKNLIKQGVREITLLGQNVTAYHGISSTGQEWNMAALVLHLAEIDGLDRIRYTTSHPRDMDDSLISAHASCPKLMPFLHLPVQSGSDAILKAMNRQHTAKAYLSLIERFRSARPDIAFSSDFIIGFPGETDKDFKETLTLIQSVGYAQAYSFKYSPRPGTPASVYENQVEEHVKDERLQILQDLIRQQQTHFNQKTVGKILPVLIEKKGRHPGQYIGRTPYMQSAHAYFDEDKQGEICHIKITGVGQNSLKGEMWKT